jgi:hypothetical protein
MQQDKNFKAVSALLEELIELIARFNRLVNKISSTEVSASNVEFELTKLQKRLKEIVSSNKPGRAHARNNSGAESGISPPNGRSPAQDAHSSRSTAPPSNLYEETVEFFNLFQSVGKRYRELSGRINSIDDAAINIDLALRRIQERLKDLINKDLLPINGTGVSPVPRTKGKLPPHVVEALRWSAESGVDSLGIKRFANGRAEFEIEGTKLTLSPRLAKVLIVLSEDIGSSKDDLVGWKSIEELVQRVLDPKHGAFPMDTEKRKKQRRVIFQNIYLLGKSLSIAGMNPFLIQRNAQLGYRFALKRKQIQEMQSIR